MAMVNAAPAWCMAWNKAQHPTWVGMQVSFWDLTCWSCIMATAHGAGLMIISVLLGARTSFCVPSSTSVNISAAFDPVLSAVVVAAHTISHLAVSGLIAWLVYDFIGLAVLRHTWINLDLIWFCSLLGAALVSVCTDCVNSVQSYEIKD